MCRIRICAFVSCIWLVAGVATGRGIVVDHHSVSLFEEIPDRYLKAARNLRLLFMDRSVGVNTHDALDCFTATDYGSSRGICRRDYSFVNGSWKMRTRRNGDLLRNEVPAYIRFVPDPDRYDRKNWSFYLFHGPWDRMVADFINGLDRGAIPVQTYLGQEALRIAPLDFDVLSFQFGYLNVMNGSRINSFYSRSPGEFDDVYDLEREVEEVLSSADPPRVFVYWTTNLARSIGTKVSSEFNERMRQFCVENDRVLFDFADIQAHDMFGRPCFDNRDGVPYSTPRGNKRENEPDDGLDIPAICQEKTVETNGGHLSTAQGTISVAKGLWVLMARIAGWEPPSPKK